MRRHFLFPLFILALSVTLHAQEESDPMTDRVTLVQGFPFPNTTNLDMGEGTVTCPAGSVLITGGAEISSYNGGLNTGLAMVYSRPEGNGWAGGAREMTEKKLDGVLVKVTAVCGYLERNDNPHIQTVAGKFPITYSNNIDNISGSVACPTGTTVISGGAKVGSDYEWLPEKMTLYNSRVNLNGWAASARETYPTAYHGYKEYLWVTALCADAGSGVGTVKETTKTVEMTDNTGSYDLATATATCPSGKTRFGGGALITTSTGVLPDYMSLVHGDFKNTGEWTAVAQELAPNATYKKKITASILCGENNGITGIESYSQTVEFGSGEDNFLDYRSHSAYCPSGKTVIGGGFRLSSQDGTIPPRMNLLASLPFANGWSATVREHIDEDRSTNPVYLTVTALCAELPD